MPEKKIIITDVKSSTNKKGDKDCRIITDAKDNKFWIWNPHLFKLCVADTAVMLTGETQGDYFNVDNIEALEEGEAPTLVEEAKAIGAKEIKTTKTDPKNRAFSAAYAKDHIGTIITRVGLDNFKSLDDSTEQIVKAAKRICKYLDTGE